MLKIKEERCGKKNETRKEYTRNNTLKEKNNRKKQIANRKKKSKKKKEKTRKGKNVTGDKK